MKPFNPQAIRDAADDGRLEDELNALLEERLGAMPIIALLDNFGVAKQAWTWATEEYVKVCEAEHEAAAEEEGERIWESLERGRFYA